MMCPRAQTDLKEEVISWIDSFITELVAILTAAIFILVYKNILYLYTRKNILILIQSLEPINLLSTTP